MGVMASSQSSDLPGQGLKDRFSIAVRDASRLIHETSAVVIDREEMVFGVIGGYPVLVPERKITPSVLPSESPPAGGEVDLDDLNEADPATYKEVVESLELVDMECLIDKVEAAEGYETSVAEAVAYYAYFGRGMSYADIAAHLNVTEEQVKERLSTASH